MARECLPCWPLYLAVVLLSGGVLGFEVLLLRLFTLLFGHHFASMVISLALLGLGAGGTFLRLGRSWLFPGFAWSFPLCCLLFAAALPWCLQLAGLIRFNPLEVVWSPGQWLALFWLYLDFALPFFFAGTGLGLALTSGRLRISRVYAADLFGAAAGGGLIILLLFALKPVQALGVLSGCALLAALCSAATLCPGKRPLPFVFFLLGVVALLFWFASRPEPPLSEYKGLSRTLLLPGTDIVTEKDTPFGRVTVVRSPEVPFRYAPGLSHHCRDPLPRQSGLFIDGEMFGVINHGGTQSGSPGATDCLPTAVAYHLQTAPEVLCNQAGQGLCILEGVEHRAGSIDGVQDNPAVVSLLREGMGERATALYRAPGVEMSAGSLRSFLAAHPGPYDLIRLWTPGTRNVSMRSQPLQEEFDFTVQAFQTYLGHLRDGGLLLVAHWLSPLWSETIKLAATAHRAYLGEGESCPAGNMGLILSQSTALFLCKKGPLQESERRTIRSFADQRGFQTLFFNELRAAEGKTGERNEAKAVLARMYTLLEKGDRDRAGFRFHVQPATDSSPYFNRFFSWASLPELWRLRKKGGAPLLQWGYLVLLCTLVQALAAGGLLIVLPVVLARREKQQASMGGTLLYFICLGLAFLFVEIGLIQRMTLLLGQPLAAVTLVLVSVLFFAGLGSSQAERIGLFPAVAAIVGFCLCYLLFLPGLLTHCLGWPWWARLLIGIAVSGPPAFFMGIPFPAGLNALAGRAPAWTPWAFAVNGCASVLSPLLAALICLHLGFAWLITAAAVLYVLAWFSFPGSIRFRLPR